MGLLPVSFVERRLLSRHGRSTLLLIVVVAVASASVMAMAAGGRRSSTSYDRFLVWAESGDAFSGGMSAESSEQGDEMLTALAALPQVESSSRSLLVGDGVRLADGQTFLGTVYPVALDWVESSERAKVLKGRLPLDSAADEAVVGFVTAERLGIGVGDRIDILFGWPGDDGSRVAPVEVVGVIAYSGGFPSLTSRPDSIVGLTNAFREQHPDRVDWTNGSLNVHLRGGTDDLDAFRAAAAELGFDDITSTVEQATAVRRLVSVEARALWLVAGILTVTSLVVLFQLMRRDAWSSAEQLRQLHNLGMPNRNIVAAGALRGLRVGGVGAVGGIILAAAVSPFFPIGISRVADPHVGAHFDAVVLIAGAFASTSLSVAFAAFAVRTATRRPGASTVPNPYSIRLIRFGPVASMAARLAIGSTSRAAETSARAGFGGLVATTAVLVASTSLGASFHHLLEDPELVGGTWDMVLVIEDPDANDQARAALEADTNVAAVAKGGWSNVVVNDKDVYVMIVEPGRGIEAAVDRGQSPQNASTIALGAAELAALNVSIGDQVVVRRPVTDDVDDANAIGPTITARVTGRSILASPAYIALPLGEGGVIPLPLFERLSPEPTAVPSYFVKLREGVPLTSGYNDVIANVQHDFAFPRSDNVGLVSLEDITTLSKALYAILGLFGATALLHRLMVTTRRNRHSIATLRSLGLAPSQVSRVHMAHGTILATVTTALAIPVGLIGAVLTWRHVAQYLGAVADPTTSIRAVAAIVASTTFIAVATGAWLGFRERRITPYQLLRRE